MTAVAKAPRTAALSLLLAAAAVTASLAWQGRAGFNLGDEGFLWYGAQRVLRGEIPIRDFLSYEPGRYYWSAALMRLWQDEGIFSLRIAVALFQWAGLATALALVFRDADRARNPVAWLVVAATLMAWMFPRHKLFDVTLSILLVATLAALLRRPTLRRCLLAGIAVGLVANFGRNHGLYGAAGSLGAIALLSTGRGARIGPLRSLGAWAAGFATGVSPFLLMLALVPGFAGAFLDGIRLLFEAGSTNLPLPIPWPWRVAVDNGLTLESARQVLAGVFFLAIPAFGAIGVAWALFCRARGRPAPALLTAAALMSLPYAHFAYSRADVPHLAQGIFPFLVGALALSMRMHGLAMASSASALCAASLFVMLPSHPGWKCEVRRECVAVDVGTSRLAIDGDIAADLLLLRDLAERFAPGERAIYAAPFWPGAYAALGRRSPVWEIYPLFPRNASLQRLELQRLESAQPGFAVILDYALDGRDELRFRNTHPIIDDYIRRHFEPVHGASANPMYRVYRNPRPAK